MPVYGIAMFWQILNLINLFIISTSVVNSLVSDIVLKARFVVRFTPNYIASDARAPRQVIASVRMVVTTAAELLNAVVTPLVFFISSGNKGCILQQPPVYHFREWFEPP